MNKIDKKIPQKKIEQVCGERSTGLQGWKWVTIHQNLFLTECL